MSAHRPHGSPGDPTFSGDLRIVGLFDVGQLLMLNHATGRLAIERDGRRGYMFFRDGNIVNAVDDQQAEGEKAAYRLFAWKTGRFEFRPEPAVGTELIQSTTEAIMLEAARLLDESSPAAGPATASEAVRLLDRQSDMEALREVFHRVAREARSADRSEPSPSGWLVDVLLDADDLLLCRAGQPPRLLQDGRWRTASETAMTEEEYDTLKVRLLGTGKPPVGDGAESTRTETVRFEDGRAFLVVVHGSGEGETLCVRPLALTAPDPELLDGSPGGLVPLLDPPHTVLLVGGPSTASADRLLHTLAPMIADRRSGTTVLVADRAGYAHPAEARILQITSAEAPGLLAAVPVSNLLIASSGALGSALLPWIARAPFVAAAVVAKGDEAVVERWNALLALAGTDPDRVMSGVPIGIVYTPGPSLGDGHLPYTARAHAPDGKRRRERSELGWHLS